MVSVHWTSFDSRIGRIYVASTAKGICKITIPAQTKREFMNWLTKRFPASEIAESTTGNRQVINELQRYFDQKLAHFHTHVDMIGTEFQTKVWGEVARIRYGSTVSYKFLAKKVGKPGAYQGIGRANAANPVPIIIPCHRVLGEDDKLRGYAAGVKTKEFLLRLEGALLV